MGSISNGTINNYGNVLLPAGSQTIDVQALLNSAISAAQAPLTLLQNQQSNVQAQSTALQSISADMSALSTAIQGLTSSSGGVNAFTATSSNTSLLSASADASAQPGTHAVVINSLATTASYYSNEVASPTSYLGAGNFTLTVGSNTPVTVTLTSANNTLNTLAASINAQNLGLTASVITDANGARLALVSNTSGSGGNFSVSNNSTDLTFTQAASGANAALTVDGVPISSASNSVSGAIPGVTLNLSGAAPAQTVSLTLAPDASQAAAAVNAFVTAWNKVVADLNAQFDVSSSGTGGGVLETDNNLRSIQDQLLSAVTYAVGGNSGIVNLASMGVNMNTDGTLSVDSGTLDNALSGNYAAVQNLLQGASGVGQFLASTLTQITDPTQGSITLDLQGLSQTSQDLGTQISSMQTLLASQTQALTQQYAQMETTLQEMPQLQSQINQQLTGLSNG
jgi:flagellar hook-associated protein 2